VPDAVGFRALKRHHSVPATVTTDTADATVAADSGYRWRMLAVVSLGWAALQWGRFLLPPLLPRIQASLSLSSAAVGLALAAFTLVYALVQYPSGTYSDSLSRATLLVPGFLVILAGFAFVGIAVHPALFLVGILLVGVGKGLFASPSRALLSDLFADRPGRALGIYSAGTDIGGLLASGLAILVIGTTWRAAFVPVLVCLGLMGALFVVWNRESYILRRERLAVGDTVRRVVATRDQRERLAAYALFFFAIGGLINFFPTLLVVNGFSETLASGVYALVFVVGMVTKPVGGAVSDRYPRLLVSIGALLFSVAGLAVVLLTGSLAAVAAGTVVMAVGYKTQFPIVDSVVMDAAPDGSVGGDLGAARGLFLTTNAAGPGVVGVLAQFYSYTVAFWVLAATIALAGLILVRQYLRA
jgi:predicted MFS family arabinose efflux permease